jgi:hypothetical protein
MALRSGDLGYAKKRKKKKKTKHEESLSEQRRNETYMDFIMDSLQRHKVRNDPLEDISVANNL